MKFSTIIIIISSFLLASDIFVLVRGRYEYSKEYQSYWDLAEKASSIEKKIEGIDRFVTALEGSGLHDHHDALWMDTPNNGFNENFEALKSLQKRLHEISTMNVASFEYQTAMQQITQQEQNESGEMLEVFSGIWWKLNHIFLWGWIAPTQIIILVLIFFIGFGLKMEEN